MATTKREEKVRKERRKDRESEAESKEKGREEEILKILVTPVEGQRSLSFFVLSINLSLLR